MRSKELMTKLVDIVSNLDPKLFAVTQHYLHVSTMTTIVGGKTTYDELEFGFVYGKEECPACTVRIVPTTVPHYGDQGVDVEVAGSRIGTFLCTGSLSAALKITTAEAVKGESKIRQAFTILADRL